MAQSPAGKPRKTPKPAASTKKAAGSSASKPKAKPAPKAKPPAKPAPVPRKKPAPPPTHATKKRAPAKKAAAKSPSPALADTKKRPKPKATRLTPGETAANRAALKAARLKTQDEDLPYVITEKAQRFVDEYMVDLNASQAAIRAGYSRDTAGQIGHELLKKPEIQLALSVARKLQQERTGITADRVLREIAYVALADARELVEGKKGCCRHCWGEGHRAQHTVGEQNRRMEDHRKKGGLPEDFDQEGGIGYNPHRPPHPECPDCMGDGRLHVVINDTRNFSPAAVALYAGIKQTDKGVEVKMHSKVDALEKLMKHLGLYEKDNEQKKDPLAELLHSIASSVGNGFKPVAEDPEHRER